MYNIVCQLLKLGINEYHPALRRVNNACSLTVVYRIPVVGIARQLMLDKETLVICHWYKWATKKGNSICINLYF